MHSFTLSHPKYKKQKRGILGSFFHHLREHFTPTETNNYRPHLLAHRSLALYSTLFVAVKFLMIAATVFSPASVSFSSAITPENILIQTNLSRKDNNIPQLSWNDKLASSAQAKAEDLASKGYFAHNSPDGKTPWDFIAASGYDYLHAGENLAEGFFEAETTEEAWMNSPGHRANILNSNYKEMGVGIATGKYNNHTVIFVVQHFGSRLQYFEQKERFADVQPAAAPYTTQPAKVLDTRVIEPRSKPEVVPVISIESNSITTTADNRLMVTIKTKGQISKAVLSIVNADIPMDKVADDTWQVSVDFESARGNKLVAHVYDSGVGSATQEVANISNTFTETLQNEVVKKEPMISIFGRQFNVQAIETAFYLFFAAALLTVLVLAIGIKRHVQHLGLIANTSFVVILAVFLWLH